MGGIGKTAVAKTYMTQYAKKYTFIIWLTVQDNNSESIRTAFINDQLLINNLDLQDTLDKLQKREDYNQQAYRFILDRLYHKMGNNLLIIDNANNKAALEAGLSDLKKTGWKILLTSRAKPSDYQIIPIDELPMPEAKLLFYRHYNEGKPLDNQPFLEEILTTIERHTLLIELIAKASKKARLSLPALSEKNQNAILQSSNPKSINRRQ